MLLPPIIFAASFNIPHEPFLKNLPTILFFGIFSTIISYIILNQSSKYLTSLLPEIQLSQLSAILVSTDTIAAVSIVKASQFPTLNAILLGEGIVNDAIAIVLYRISDNFSLITFVYIFFGSVSLGVLGFVIGGLYFKSDQCETPIKEMALIILMNYCVYLCAELLGLSGIMALFVSGVGMRAYVVCNLS